MIREGLRYSEAEGLAATVVRDLKKGAPALDQLFDAMAPGAEVGVEHLFLVWSYSRFETFAPSSMPAQAFRAAFGQELWDLMVDDDAFFVSKDFLRVQRVSAGVDTPEAPKKPTGASLDYLLRVLRGDMTYQAAVQHLRVPV